MISRVSLINFLRLFFIFLYVFYTFWFQYAFYSVAGFLTILGFLMLGLSIIPCNGSSFSVKELVGIIIFVVYCSTIGLTVSNHMNTSFGLALQIIKYCIPLFAIYVYVGKSEKKLDHVMISILIACAILSIWSFYKPIYTVSYSETTIVEGLLNPNIFSSYMMLGMIACTFLLSKSKVWLKIPLYIISFCLLFAQLNAASRRGIVVCAFIMLAYLISTIAYKKYKHLFNKVLSFIGLLLLCVAAYVFLAHFADDFIGLQRLQGSFVSGDVLRAYYQSVAFDIFKENPFFGKGLGAVSIEIGMYSHSLYYELLACTGIIGTILILAYILRNIIFYGMASIRNNYLKTKDKYHANLLFWYGVAMLVSGVAVVLIYDSYFYILLGIFASSTRVIKNKNIISCVRGQFDDYEQKRIQNISI